MIIVKGGFVDTTAGLVYLFLFIKNVIVNYNPLDQIGKLLGLLKIESYLFLFIELVVVSLILGAVSIFFMHFIRKHLRNLKYLSPSNQVLLINIIQIFIFFTMFLVGLQILGLHLTSLTMFGSALFVGVGIGLQKIASNFISGLILLAEQSIRVGDMIEMDKDYRGYVRYTGTFFTIIELFDGSEVIVPNENLLTNKVVNLTLGNRKIRLTFTITISYESDIDKVKKVVLDSIGQCDTCAKEPGPSCWLKEFAERGAIMEVLFWIDDVTQGNSRIRHDVMNAVLKALRKNKIEMITSPNIIEFLEKTDGGRGRN